MPFFLNGQEIEPDAQGGYQACCSVCFQDKYCVSITYEKIMEICKSFDIPTYSFAICEKCLNMSDRRALHLNIMDYFVMNELTRWVTGDKTGIIHSQHEFNTLLNIAYEQGIIYREEKRLRFRYAKKERQFQLGFIDLLKREKSGDYIPNTFYQSIFKNLYKDN
jgi:hypothetical protein